MRRLLLILAALMPLPLKLLIYRRLLKWRIGKNARIGWSYLDAGQVTLGDNVRIGHFNLLRGIKHLSIGSETYIANFNQMFGAAYPEWASTLIIGTQVNFMSRHFIDVGGTVTIGDRAIIGGRDTQFWSHTRAFIDGVPSLQPTSVHIGENVYIGARAMLVSCAIPAGAIVGAGSVVTKSFAAEEARLLIAGNPATIRKRYDLDAETP
jgi:acetyltransferase-like isoleucine patch superfamily enzyme